MSDPINPRRLRQDIDDGIEHIFSLPGAVPGSVENVYLSLAKNRQKATDDELSFEFNRTPIRE